MGYESWVERDRLMVLDADPEVIAVAAQPMWLHWVDAETFRARGPRGETRSAWPRWRGSR